jgi:hypothetical protein
MAREFETAAVRAAILLRIGACPVWSASRSTSEDVEMNARDEVGSDFSVIERAKCRNGYQADHDRYNEKRDFAFT